MEGNGFTGFNDQLYCSQIKSFADSCVAIEYNFFDRFYDFLEKASEIWASPNAVEFDKFASEKYEEVYKEFVREVIAIINKGDRTIQWFAEANGVNKHYDNASLGECKKGGFGPYGLKEATADGVVGMNISEMENLINEFEISISNIISDIESLPSSIAVYDDADQVRHSYSLGISAFRSRMEDFLKELVSQIKSYMNTERNAVELSAKKAVEALESLDI